MDDEQTKRIRNALAKGVEKGLFQAKYSEEIKDFKFKITDDGLKNIESDLGKNFSARCFVLKLALNDFNESHNKKEPNYLFNFGKIIKKLDGIWKEWGCKLKDDLFKIRNQHEKGSEGYEFGTYLMSTLSKQKNST